MLLSSISSALLDRQTLFSAMTVVSRILAFAIAIPFHEVAHAFVSNKLGDPTAKNLGRITLNPIKHLDPLGLLAMLIIGIGWAKPVPIDPRYYKNRKKGMALTALAGPVSNLLLAFGSIILYRLFAGFYFLISGAAGYTVWAMAVSMVIQIFAIINVNLAIFNMIPIPPFDGSRVLGIILPEKYYFDIQKYERYIMVGVLVVMFVLPRFFNVDPIGWLLNKAGGAVINFMMYITSFIDKIFQIFV